MNSSVLNEVKPKGGASEHSVQAFSMCCLHVVVMVRYLTVGSVVYRRTVLKGFAHVWDVTLPPHNG